MVFLSIVTRCSPGRAELQERNRQSVAAQTDQDIEHIVIEDAGVSLYDANESLFWARGEVGGEYVYILDDDDYLCDPDFVAEAKKAAAGLSTSTSAGLSTSPDVIVVRMRRLRSGELLPDEAHWGRRPVQGKIGSPCFLVRREVWMKHIASFGRPRWGDYYFIRELWDGGYSFCWLDRVVAEVDRGSGA